MPVELPAGVLLPVGQDVAVRSVTVLPSGPYGAFLPGAPSIPTPSGVVTGKVWDYGGMVWNAKGFGAKGDTQIASGSMTINTAILTITTSAFVAADVGKAISVFNGLGVGTQLVTTILSYQSATQVTLSANCTATVTTQGVTWGTDDTAAINAALTVAGYTSFGAVVLLPLGRYWTSSALVINAGVRLRGALSPIGIIFGNTDLGTVLVPAPGAYDVIVTGAGDARAAGVEDLAIDGGSDSSHWGLHVLASTGFYLRNFAMHQDFNGAQGILFDGAANGVYQCRMDNVSVNTGGGYLGTVGIQFGVSGAAVANANTGNNIQVQGYTTGINFQNGGGNVLTGVWLQFDTTGASFNSSQNTIVGGWLETLTTGFAFTANSVNGLVIGMRKVGTVTTLYTDAGVGTRLIDVDGNDYGNVTQVGNLNQTGNMTASGYIIGLAAGGGTTLSLSGGQVGSQGAGAGLVFGDRTGSRAWQWYGTASIARLNSGSADVASVDTGGKMTVAPSTATAAGGSTTGFLSFGSAPALGIYFGSGAPSISAPKGSLYLRTDATTNTSRAYIATDAVGTWTAINTVG